MIHMISQVAFRVDSDLKKKALARSRQEGISLNSAIILFLKSYTQGRIHIGLQLDEEVETLEDKQAYEEAMKDYKTGEVVEFEDFRKKLQQGKATA